MLAELAPAKINVALHVRRRRPDGYHDIETLFAFARAGDTLQAEPAADLSLEIDGPEAGDLPASDDNLILRAARALASATGRPAGARLRLTKRLPVASGIGGGSADCAAALRLLSRLWEVPVPPDLAASLGADVPACLLGRTAWADGRGYPLHPIIPDPLAGVPVLLVNPRVPVSTAAVFRAWDGTDRGGLPHGGGLHAALAGRNDLEAPARAIAPVIAELLAELRALRGVTLARMSGSGATCFALFDTTATRDVGAAAVGDRPGRWCLATELG